jgi:tetratricopeptide (TPR) repeat protein
MLATNGDAPLLLVGIGHVELLYGNTTDSRQRFERAISLTKEKDVNVLNAVGYANTDAKAGDANYAIQKLMLATETRRFHDAETYVLLGDAYRKLLDGGNAVLNYNKALGLDPKLAEAKLKIGIIYLTQNNRDYFLPAFEEAVTIDPAYAPAYHQLFLYWYSRDVNKASAYLDKYLANSDPGPDAEYLKTDMLYASSKFADARTRAQQLISQMGDKVIPRMYRMVAYASDTLGDLATAKTAMTEFFSKADTSSERGLDYTILPTDYEEYAKIYSKMPDSASQSQAFQYYIKAIAMDTLAANKEKYANAGLELAKKLKNPEAAAILSEDVYKAIKDPNNSDLYKYGMANYSAGNYKKADSIFCGLYESKYPNEIYGYLWCAKSKQAQDDSLNSQGLAVEAYDKLAKFARSIPDSAKYKNQIISSYYYLASYYNDIKKDKNTAIEYMQKVLEVDPGNESAKNIINMLQKPPARPPAPRGKGTHGKTGD